MWLIAERRWMEDLLLFDSWLFDGLMEVGRY